MSTLATRAELDKLGETLGVEPASLGFLEEVPAEQLRALRAAIYERMFSEDRELYRRMAAIAARLPVGIAINLAERLGPLVTARVAAEIPSRRAFEIAMRISTAFTSEVFLHLDPRRTADVLRQLPAERVAEVAHELTARGQFMAMSRFTDFFGDDVIRAVVEEIDDEGVFLRVSFYMGSKNRLDHLFRLLPPERLERLLLRVEEESNELLSPFLSLLIHVSYGLKRRFGDLAAAQDESVLTGYVRAAHDQGLWGEMLPVVAAMSETARERVVNLAVLREPAVQESIIRAADEHALWGIVLPMVDLMDDTNREAVAGIVAGRGRQTLELAADAALMGEHWTVLLDLVQRMPPSKQEEFGSIVQAFGDVDSDLLERIVRGAEERGFGERLTVSG